MPAVSGPQYRMMAMIAHGKKPTMMKSMGPSKAVAREFVKKTPSSLRKKWSKSNG